MARRPGDSFSTSTPFSNSRARLPPSGRNSPRDGYRSRSFNFALQIVSAGNSYPGTSGSAWPRLREEEADSDGPRQRLVNGEHAGREEEVSWGWKDSEAKKRRKERERKSRKREGVVNRRRSQGWRRGFILTQMSGELTSGLSASFSLQPLNFSPALKKSDYNIWLDNCFLLFTRFKENILSHLTFNEKFPK